ncbi:MAG TPA: Ppx/GppA family phosphatase, partial [Allosphingosinicella sp.]|nr:Ppx/GppA family phosphatase [Allosphingosinicella sp.]
GGAFLEKIRDIGLEAEVISGAEEGRLAGLGVASGIPQANGIAADLGGGSLELVEVADASAGRSGSLPRGVRRRAALPRERKAFASEVAEAVAAAGFTAAAAGRCFYLVGGSWRTLARLDMYLTDHPLPITHQHALAPGRPRELADIAEKLGEEDRARFPALSASRLATLPLAARLLAALAEALRPDQLVVSSFGIREGLLYDALEPEVRRLDPLIEAAREAGAGAGRFAQHGERLDAWIAPLFDDAPEAARLRLAACHLADIAWAAHPEFRAERGIDMALHGNWVAIDARGRVMLAQALSASFGGEAGLPSAALAALCSADELNRAACWGQAIRLGQKLSGGVSAPLEASRLVRSADCLRLEIDAANAVLAAAPVERRLKALAAALGLRAELP